MGSPSLGRRRNALMSALATDSERERIRFLVQTGLRKSEFANLRWKDVDLKAGVITIQRSKNGETRHVPKTSVVRAILGRMPRPIAILQCLCFRAAKSLHALGREDVPEAVKIAQINDCRFHDLRHTFASRLAMEGVDLLTIKELGGWKTLSMVQRYAHPSPSHRKHAIERLVTRKIEHQSAARERSSTVISTRSTMGTPRAAEVPIKNGGPSRTRTLDPLIKSQLLYQLS